jgi:ABC-2 type transport system permease protein
MIAILKKEISSFFSSPIGYLVIAVFLLINGLFLFLFGGEYHILDNGLANMSPFFMLAPWVFLFLIPAITMKSFSDEMKQGTLELLLTMPVSPLKIVLGKFLGALLLVVLALIPTLLYVYTIYRLGLPPGNLDLGSIAGSYFGLLFLASSFTAVGLFTSSLTDNQIVAFISAVFICLLMFYGFEGLAGLQFLANSVPIDSFGMAYHFKSMGRGIIDTRDLIYFLSITVFFLAITRLSILKK